MLFPSFDVSPAPSRDHCADRRWEQEPDQNEISLELVPSDHSLVPPVNLEAEASGLLDRLLGIFQDDIRQVSRGSRACDVERDVILISS